MTSGMFYLSAFAVALVLAFLTGQLAVVLARSDAPPVVTGPPPKEWEAAAGRMRRVSLVSILAGAITLILLSVIPYPETWLGVPHLLAPMLAVLVALIVYTLQTSRQPAPTEEDEAGEPPRSAAPKYVTKGYAFVLALAVTALLVTLIIAGVRGSPDDMGRIGRTLTITVGNQTTHTGPFPGWFYGIPVLIVALLVVLAGYGALRSVARRPLLPGHKLRAANSRWSLGTSRVIILITLSVIFFELAVVLFLIMAAARTGLASLEPPHTSHWWLTGLAQLVVAAAFAAFGCLAHAMYNTITLRRKSAAALVSGDEGVTLP